MTNKIRTIISLLLATGLMAFGAAAHADSFTVELSSEFSGATPPEGSTPWLTATFDDGGTAGTVTMTVVANLTDAEFVSGFYWNISEPSHLTDGFLAAANTVGFPSCAFSVDSFKSDGAGYHDLICSFSNGQWTDGGVFAVDWFGPDLVAADFDSLSTASSKGQFTAAAHIQSIGDDNQDSGWIGGTGGGNEVPEPGTLALFGLGLTLMGVATRRRRPAPKA